MISKELLSEVFGEKRVILDYEVSINKTEIHYGHKDIDEDGFINIYELAYKCKEWAIGEYGFSLHSFPCPDDTYTCEIYKFHKSTGYVIVDWFNCLSEVESIFKACQWILDNKEAK